MAHKDVRQEIAALRTEIHRHNRLYYVGATPEIGEPPPLLEVRGEVYMTNSELVRLNELRRAREELPFANPRNATAGSLKLLDPRLCGQRRLQFISHGLGAFEGIEVASYLELLKR